MYYIFRRLLRCCIILLGLLTYGARADVQTPDLALMPAPQSVHIVDSETENLGKGIEVQWAHQPSPRLNRAEQRFLSRLRHITGRTDVSHPIMLHIAVGRDHAYLSVAEKEDYTLSVTSKGVFLSASGEAGVLHGLATLLQLVQMTPEGAIVPHVVIKDAPRFAWRGVMIDASRHFMSVDTIHRQLDAMELTKLNVLHWHLSDGASFRVESHRFPRLQQISSHNQYYTQKQVREIVSYAADRGIRVVPEFDVPGHAFAIVRAYPEMAAQPLPSEADIRSMCHIVIDPNKLGHCVNAYNLNNAALDPTKARTIRFITALYKEMGQLFPDQYFHAGGDEVVGSQWTTNPAIARYMKQHGYRDAMALQAAFTVQIAHILAQQGKIMMGWDEISEAPIPRNVVVEVWRGSKWTGYATKAGHPVVVSAGYYLDLLNPSSFYYQIDPLDTKAVGLSPDEVAQARDTVGDGIDAFALDAHAEELDAAQQKHILGGDAPLWSETLSDEMLSARLWPRSIAIAERFWSDKTQRDVGEMQRRLPIILRELNLMGLQEEAHRREMIARMAPENTEPLKVLTSVTSPVRNAALNRLALNTGDIVLDAPMAVANPDSFEAMRFNELAARYVRGEARLAQELMQRLQLYQANEAAYARIATTPILQAALPISHQLAELARLGMEAMANTSHSKAWRKKAQALLAQQDAVFAACASTSAVQHSTIPASGLLIDIVPGLHLLVDHAL